MNKKTLSAASRRRPLLAAAPGAPTVAELFDMPAIAWAVAVDVALFACLVTLERLQPWTCDLGPDSDGVHDEGQRPPTRCLTENPERARLS